MPKYTELRAKRNKDGEWTGGSVYRQTVEPLDHRGRKIIVGLEPGDVISFREKGTRRTFTIPIRWAMMQAIRRDAEKQRGEKRQRKTLAKRGLL